MGLSAFGRVTFPRLTPNWVVRDAERQIDLTTRAHVVTSQAAHVGIGVAESIGILNVGEGTRVPCSGPTGFPGACSTRYP